MTDSIGSVIAATVFAGVAGLSWTGVLSSRTFAWTSSTLWSTSETDVALGAPPSSCPTCSARVISDPSHTPACSTRWVKRWSEPSSSAWSWAAWLVSLSVARSARADDELMVSLRSPDWVRRCSSLLEESSILSSRSGPISPIRTAASWIGPSSKSRRASSSSSLVAESRSHIPNSPLTPSAWFLRSLSWRRTRSTPAMCDSPRSTSDSIFASGESSNRGFSGSIPSARIACSAAALTGSIEFPRVSMRSSVILLACSTRSSIALVEVLARSTTSSICVLSSSWNETNRRSMSPMVCPVWFWDSSMRCSMALIRMSRSALSIARRSVFSSVFCIATRARCSAASARISASLTMPSSLACASLSAVFIMFST